MQFFILKSPEIRNNAINFINALNIDHREYSVEVKQYRKNRSNAQNRLLWSWIGIISDETGYTPDELHEYLKTRLLGVEEKTIMGHDIFIPKSTTKLTALEFTQYLEKIEMLAMEMGINLPHPSDYSYIMGAK